MSKRTVILHEMTRAAFEEYLASTPVPVAIIALGSVEQHGPHLPLGTDSLCSLMLARRAAEQAGAVVVQPCLPGYSPHHMGFAGTITFSEDTLVRVVNDTVASLARHGIRRILICNAHGGNDEIVAYVARTASRRHRCKVLPAPVLPPADAQAAMRAELAEMDVHAGRRETGMALALFPELVDMTRVAGFKPTARWPDPAVAALARPDREDVLLAGMLAQAYCGDTHVFTASGVYGWTDPNDASPEEMREVLEAKAALMARFIELWRTLPEE